MSACPHGLIRTLTPSVTLSVVIFLVHSSLTLGLQHIAVALSDPFGDDDVDFDLSCMSSATYESVIALVRDDEWIPGQDDPSINPLMLHKKSTEWIQMAEP